jgi:drug/metabolite transporter (DMT)-like permease
MNKEALGTLLAVLTAIISGIAIPINKIFVVDLDPTVFTAVRSLIIGVIFLIIASFQSNFDYKKFKKVSWKYLLAIAIIGGAFAFLLFFNGLKLTTAGRGAFIHKTLPLYVLVLAFIFLKEKITEKQLFALLLMFIGTIVLYSAQINPTELWANPSIGDILIIGATFLWAVENVIAKKAMIKGENNFVVSFTRMFFGGLILFGFLLLIGKYDLLLRLQTEQILNIAISTAILFGYVFCWYWSIKLINVSKASTILLLAPVISLLFGVILLGEPVPIRQLAGSVLILIGAYFAASVRSEFVQAN